MAYNFNYVYIFNLFSGLYPDLRTVWYISGTYKQRKSSKSLVVTQVTNR